jgi:hypothetical protein
LRYVVHSCSRYLGTLHTCLSIFFICHWPTLCFVLQHLILLKLEKFTTMNFTTPPKALNNVHNRRLTMVWWVDHCHEFVVHFMRRRSLVKFGTFHYAIVAEVENRKIETFFCEVNTHTYKQTCVWIYLCRYAPLKVLLKCCRNRASSFHIQKCYILYLFL